MDAIISLLQYKIMYVHTMFMSHAFEFYIVLLALNNITEESEIDMQMEAEWGEEG